MRGMNKVILVGNATRDAELRYTQHGKPVSNIRLETNRQLKGEEETQFHSIIWWNCPAETTAAVVLAYVVSGYVFMESAERENGVVIRYLGNLDQLVRLSEHYAIDEEATAGL
jgi:single-stranded DNA-binding protein